jgi:hypothetical protein
MLREETPMTTEEQTLDGQLPTYTAASPPRPSAEELRARIPGWGVDLDPADRPSVPKLLDPGRNGAAWDLPERQEEQRPRERSIEHRFLTPVFGTAQPTKGLSGAIRRMAYARWSEGRTAHWLALIAADRVDVYESFVGSLVTGHPDNLLGETGIKAELTGHGLRSRMGDGRTDWKHQWMDPAVVLGPWLLAGAGVVAVAKRLRR